MRRHSYSGYRWRHLRSVGRIGFALTAGGAFAALAWESSPPSRITTDAEETQEGFCSAERQGIVTEDDALPRLEVGTAGLHEEDTWGSAFTRPRDRLWAARGGATGITTEAMLEGQTPSGQTEEGAIATTAVPNPRGPP